MSQRNPFGKTYTVAQFNAGPQTLPSVGPGNKTGFPKSIRKKKKKRKKRCKRKKDCAVKEFVDFLTLSK